MKTYIAYIHGLHSDENSSKYQSLLSNFDDVDIFNWDAYSLNVEKFIDEHAKQILDEHMNSHVILIGDSTGANFALQLRDRLQKQGKYSTLVLISPLTHRKNILKASIFHDLQNITQMLQDYTDVNDALVIMPDSDDVLAYDNYSCWVEISNGDTHRLSNFHQYISHIKTHITNICI